MEKKKPVKLGSWCRLSDPFREQSTAKPRRDPPYKKVCASKPCWRINCEVVLLTVLKHSQLFKKLLCEKHVWLNFHSMPTPSTYSFRLPKKNHWVGVIWRNTWLAAGQRAKQVEYADIEKMDAIVQLTYCFLFRFPPACYFLSALHSRHSPLIWTPETGQYLPWKYSTE